MACDTLPGGGNAPPVNHILNQKMNLLEIAQSRIENGKDVPARVIEFLETRYGVSLVVTEDGYLCEMEETQFCELSENTFSDRADFTSFYRNSRGNGWNYYRQEEASGETDTVERSCFYCESTEAFYLSSDFTEIEVDGDTLCREACEDALYYWDSDGEWHYEPEPEGIPS
jgi:hypothetical protein